MVLSIPGLRGTVGRARARRDARGACEYFDPEHLLADDARPACPLSRRPRRVGARWLGR